MLVLRTMTASSSSSSSSKKSVVLLIIALRLFSLFGTSAASFIPSSSSSSSTSSPQQLLLLTDASPVSAAAASRTIIVPTTSRWRSHNQRREYNGGGGLNRRRRIPSQQQRLHMMLMSNNEPSSSMAVFEDLLYNAGTVANNLAAVGLKDPSNVLKSMPIFYVAGLLTSISPCVWGLLPLTVSYISTAAGERRDGKVLLPTLAFAAGLAAVFCTLGIAVAELGGVFGGTGSGSGTGGSSALLLPVASYGICLLMGLQLLELVDLPLPSLDFLNPRRRRQTSASTADGLLLIDENGQIMESADNNQNEEGEGGSLFRTFLLGGSSALVASPCATPVLTSILGFVASSKDPVVGAALLFGYTLGYATPLLVVASTGGQALVQLRKANNSDGDGGDVGNSIYGKIAPWVTPFTAGILLWYGTNGMLIAVLGDPSLAGLAPIIE